MTNFAKVIKVENVKGIKKILIHIDRNEELFYACCITANIEDLGVITIEKQAQATNIEDENYYEGSKILFDIYCKKTDQEIIAEFTESAFYKAYLDGLFEG